MPSYMLSSQEERMVDLAPPSIQALLRNQFQSRARRAAIATMMERQAELGGPVQAMLAVMLMDPDSRSFANKYWNRYWGPGEELIPDATEEVIIGAGLHAAVYCATRAEMARRAGRPHVPPLVLEAKDRVGGAFAVSDKPSFYLNSRNRPGGQGVPGEGGSLNNIPFAPLQVSAISNTEYLTNQNMADIIRLTLACYARVATRIQVISIKGGSRLSEGDREAIITYTDALGSSRFIRTKRVILATGLTEPKWPVESDRPKPSRQMLYYNDFMARMDETFPFRGMRRVAVIGAGDSGKTVVESLLGQGPQAGWSSAGLDWIEKIDWYGVGAGYNEQNWCTSMRGRYRNIGVGFRSTNRGRRVRPLDNVSFVSMTPEMIYLDGRPYDHVIVACGYEFKDIKSKLYGSGDLYTFGRMTEGGRWVGQRTNNGYPLFAVGPFANLQKSSAEELNPAMKFTENLTAIWRYASRTAGMAASFPVSGNYQPAPLPSSDADDLLLAT